MRKPSLILYLVRHPSAWLLGLGLALLYVITFLPHISFLKLGKSLGNLMYYLLRKRRRIAHINITHCFPELNPCEQKKLVKEHFQAVGIAVCETGMAWWTSTAKLRPLVHFSGETYLEQGLAQGKGVLLIGAHFTTMDIVGRFSSFLHPVYAVYKRQKNPLINELLQTYRQQEQLTLINSRNLRAILQALSANQIVWYAYDQDFGAKRCVFAPFFGIQTATLKTPMRLAQLSQATVLFATHYRDPKGYYHITIHPPLANFPSDDFVADATQLNQFFEKVIREYPEQYFWLHRRFKTRPPEEKISFYSE